MHGLQQKVKKLSNSPSRMR